MELHFLVPCGIDDPSRPSGGNTYDRRLSRELTSFGWSVHEHAVPGSWPNGDEGALAALAGVLERLADRALVIVDGLIASSAPTVLVPQADRLRLVILVHMPLGHRPREDQPDRVRARERAALGAAAAVVTTSAWSRRRLIELYALPHGAVHVAEPGVDPAEPAVASAGGAALLCVAAVRFEKGHDVLLDALSRIADLPWRCECVGSLDAEPAFAEDVRRRTVAHGLDRRVSFAGPRAGADLDRAYRESDLMVLASRAETYGMVVTEALARGVPVLVADVGGVREAIGAARNGSRPGLLVPPEDPPALADALRGWLGDAALRGRLRRAARRRRESLPEWSSTASAIAAVLTSASA